MSRPLRIELAGGLYHVTSRGDRREDIYHDDADRAAWLTVLAGVCQRYGWRCHAWCQMSNHYHLVVETPEANLAMGMRQLNGLYTQYINRRYRRVGHVFQGRYKAIVVERDAYLLELGRYVVLNPVRAGMVGQAGDWRWSSYAAMLDDLAVPPWLETRWLLGQFSDNLAWARQCYVDFVAAGVGLPSLWERLQGQIYLGSEEFVQEMQAAIDASRPLGEIPRLQRRAPPEPLVVYRDRYPDRDAAIYAAFASRAYTLREIGDFFGLHYASVSRIVKRFERDAKGS